MMKKEEIAVEEYLEKFPTEIKIIANKLRDIILDTIPNINEAVYTGWKLIGYKIIKGNKSFYFCFIAPFDNKVNLGFEYGYKMTENILLKSAGKQVKYVEFEALSQINIQEIQQLIGEAAMLAVEKSLPKI
jgi:hypothetical protein